MTVQKQLEAFAPAKINLFLDVKGKRSDGYHEIATVMQTVDLYDRLLFSQAPGPGIELVCEGEGLPPEGENLVVRAAVLLRDRFRTAGSASVELKKRIPAGAGLGGGSSDAAATLKALSRLWNLEPVVAGLRELAAELGSDIPFFVSGGAAICTGRGECIERIDAGGGLDFVIAMPRIGISTAKAYAAVDSLTKEARGVNIERTVRSLEQGDPEMLGMNLHNGLRDAAAAVDPRVKEIETVLGERFTSTGSCGYSISGSGAAWFGVSRNRRQAMAAAEHIGRSSCIPALAVRSVFPEPACGEQPEKRLFS